MNENRTDEKTTSGTIVDDGSVGGGGGADVVDDELEVLGAGEVAVGGEAVVDARRANDAQGLGPLAGEEDAGHAAD